MAWVVGNGSRLSDGSPMKWADAVLMGEVKGTRLEVFDVSGSIELGAKLDDPPASGNIAVASA